MSYVCNQQWRLIEQCIQIYLSLNRWQWKKTHLTQSASILQSQYFCRGSCLQLEFHLLSVLQARCSNIFVFVCVFPQCQWLLSAQCLIQLVSCACRWLKQSINIGLQLLQFIFKEQWQRGNVLIQCLFHDAQCGRSEVGRDLAWLRDCLHLRTSVYTGKCVSVCLCMRVYVLEWQQIAIGEWAISRTFSLLVQWAGWLWKWMWKQEETCCRAFPNGPVASSCPNRHNRIML